MLKYTDTAVTLREIPLEVTLCINISNCPCHCKGCHSSYLAEDIGERLYHRTLDKLIESNDGITCICFMGGDSDPGYINELASYIKEKGYSLMVAWYSGKAELSEEIKLKNFNYIKLGPYIEEHGPLDNPNTNQRLYQVKVRGATDIYGNWVYELEDITNLFWREWFV